MSTRGDFDGPGAMALRGRAPAARAAALVALCAVVLLGSLLAVRSIGGSGVTAGQSTVVSPATTPGHHALVLPEPRARTAPR